MNSISSSYGSNLFRSDILFNEIYTVHTEQICTVNLLCPQSPILNQGFRAIAFLLPILMRSATLVHVAAARIKSSFLNAAPCMDVCSNFCRISSSFLPVTWWLKMETLHVLKIDFWYPGASWWSPDHEKTNRHDFECLHELQCNALRNQGLQIELELATLCVGMACALADQSWEFTTATIPCWMGFPDIC